MTNTNILTLLNPYQNSGVLTYTPTIPRTNIVFVNDGTVAGTVMNQAGLNGYKPTVLPSGSEVMNLPGKPMSSIEAAKIIVEADRVGSGLKPDSGHRSASFLTLEDLQQGKTFTISGYDKSYKTLLQVNGELNGQKGIFEYILTPEGEVSHQRFINGGIINGIENQKVPKGGYK